MNGDDPTDVPLPPGFVAHVANVGIKDDTDDIAVVVADRPCAAAAVFTRSRFAGPSVAISRDAVADGTLRATVVVSKNANVANGPVGRRDAEELQAGVAKLIGVPAADVLVTSTGVIGRPYPMDRVRAGLGRFPSELSERSALAVATAMMTTDTRPKVAAAAVGSASVVGVAKGVGMIEPDMATMLAMIYTDADVDPGRLDALFRRVVDRTFNSLSIDTDTSTSDTAAILANGSAGTVDEGAFEAAVLEVCTDLTRQLATDGEGATKLIVVDVAGGRDDHQARRVAKTIVNSPLVKTAVHGADPNWGRIAMAIGKCSDDTDIDERVVVIRIGGQELYPTPADDDSLADLTAHLRGSEIRIEVDLGIAEGAWRVYGCDLSDGYVRINADYTT